MALVDWLNARMFNFVHQNNLVYNTCWEDPRLDRVAMDIGPKDNILVITSAGCNALDYALNSPNAVHAVDMNPRQNALLELKQAGIRNLEFEDFFSMFGQGSHDDAAKIYRQALRSSLSPWSRNYWDKKIKLFDRRKSFYFFGTSGRFARFVNFYVDRIVRVRPWIEQLLSAQDVEEQRAIYDDHLKERFWTKPLDFAMGQNATLSMVGVPRAQRQQVDKHYEGGIVQFIHDCIESVFAQLPIHDNYFWRVYLTGEYTPDCCPEYLKPENFQALKGGLVDKVHTYTDSVEGFLRKHDVEISRYVLLDHMDWLSTQFYPLLESEWQAILQRATPNARILWRSGGLKTDFVDRVNVQLNGRNQELGELLTYHKEMADELHKQDRVHTYGSFYIADLAA